MLSSLKQLINDRGSGGVFSSLSVFPKGTRFEALDQQEEIVMLLRPHIITNLWWVVIASVLLFVPALWPALPVISLLPGNYLFVITLFWYALILSFVFEQFIMWFFSVNIITDERIMDVDFFGLLFKHVSVSQLDKIQDVNYFQKGVMGSFFNYGNVLIQTAAEVTQFVFNNVPNPDRVTKVISELIQQERQEELEGRVR